MMLKKAERIVEKRTDAIAYENKRENYLCKHNNIKYKGLGVEGYVEITKVRKCKRKRNDAWWKGRRVWLGIDLSMTEDNVCVDMKTYEGKERVFIPPISPAESFEQFWDAYPNKVRRSMAETAYCDMILSEMVTEEQLVAAAKNYAEYCEIQKIDKIYYPNNFISKCVFDDFLPENYKKPKRTADSKKSAGSKFNNFNQREYDYEDLERRLLQGGN